MSTTVRKINPIVLIIALVAISFGIVSAQQAPSSAAPVRCTERVGGTLPGGPGHPDTVYTGTWTCGTIVGFCGDFVKHNPNGSGGTAVIKNMPNMSSKASAVFSIINHTYRLTKDRATAMAAGYAEWKVQHTAGFNKYDRWAAKKHKFSSLRKRANSMIQQATRLAGLKLHVKLKDGYTGQTKTDYVLNTGTGGKPVSGIVNRLSVNSNGKLSRTRGTSNRKGHTSFGLTKTETGGVTVRASAQTPNVHYIESTVPSVGSQHIFAVPHVRTISAVASFNKKLGKPTVSSVCDTNCDGNAKMAVHWCNPKNAAKWTYFGHDQNGKLVVTFSVRQGACKTKHFTMHDGDELHSSYRLSRKGQYITPAIQVGKPYKVKCPRGTNVFFSDGCNCQGLLKYTVLVQQLANVRGYKVVIKDVTSGSTESHTLSMGDNTYSPKGIHAGDKVSVKVTAFDKSTKKNMRTWSFSDVVSSPTAA